MKNYSKLFFSTLVAAGTLFAGTQFANATEYTGLTVSSGTTTISDGDILQNRETTDTNYGSDSYNLGILIGRYSAETVSSASSEADYKKFDLSVGAWINDYYVNPDNGSISIDYYAYDAIAVLTGTAKVTTTGTVKIVGNEESKNWNDTNSTSNWLYKSTSPIIVMTDSSTWTNTGTLDASGSYVELYMVGNSVFENSGTFYGDEIQLDLKGNSTLKNAGILRSTQISSYSGSDYRCEIELRDNATFENTGTAYLDEIDMDSSSTVKNSGKLYVYDIGLEENATFTNLEGGEMLPLRKDSPNLTFYAEVAGTMKFQNYGTAELYRIDFEIDADEEDGYDTSAKAIVENYGTMSIDYEVGFSAYYDANYYSGEKLSGNDLTNKLTFVNRGTVTGNLDVTSFVNLTLVQGSTITGDLGFGGDADICFAEDNASTSFVADSETLNIILTGTSSNALIQGDLILENTVNLSVSAEGDALSKYSLQVWSGTLEINEGTGFVSTSGTFTANNKTYNWILDTSTGWITAAVEGESLIAGTYENLQLSSGTKTFIDGEIIKNRDTTNANYGSDSYALGVLIGANVKNSSHYANDSISWDSATGSWLEKWVGSDGYVGDYEYRQYDALIRLSGSAQMVTTGTVTLVANSSWHSDYSGYYETVSIVALTGNSKWMNAGTTVLTGPNSYNYLNFYLTDNSILENTGTILGDSNNRFDIHALGKSKIINSGTIDYVEGHNSNYFFDSASLENSGTLKLGYIEFYDNSSLSNSGTFESREIALHGNATIVNESTGTISTSYTFPIRLDFYSKIAGTARFQNYGNVEISRVNFYIDLEDGTDDYNKSFKAVIENYGTWTVSTADDSCAIDFGGTIDYGYTNYTLTDADFANKFSFTNRGTIEVEQADFSVKFSSYINVTLVGGSTITGNLQLGTCIYYEDGSAEPLKLRADSESLNVILTGTDNTALIQGDLQLGNYVTLTVSAEGDAQNRYTQVLWSGDLIADDYLTSTLNISAEDAFKTTSGTFVLAGTTYNWALDVATGTISAKSSLIGEEYIATGSTDNFLATTSKDTVDFDSSLTEYSGTISGAAEVHSSNNLEFSGNLSSFTGTLVVDAETLTVTEDATLGSASITIAQDATVEIAGTQTLTNKVTGTGTLSADGTLTIPATTSVASTITLEVSDSTDKIVLTGTQTLKNEVTGTGTLEAAGTLTIADSATIANDVSLAVSNDATIVFTGTQTLSNAVSGTGTLQAAGTLTIASGTDLGDLTLNVSKNLVLTGNQELANAVTGSGTLTLQNGNFTIGSSSDALANFAGTLKVAGDLTVSEATNFGKTNIAIAAGSTVKFESSNSPAEKQTIAGKISGSGVLELFVDSFDLKQGLTDANLEVHVGDNAEVLGPQLVIAKGWVENSTLEATDSIRLGAIELKGTNELTANNIYLAGTQISGTTTLNCHTEMVNVPLAGTTTLTIHDFSVYTNSNALVNAIVDGNADSTTVTHLADNSQPIVSGTAMVSIENCNIALTTYGSSVVMFSDGVDVGVYVYDARETAADVEDEDIITVTTPRGNGKYFYQYDENGNIVLQIMQELVQTLGYGAMPAMTIDVYTQDVKSISRDINQRLIASRFVRQQEFNFFAEGHGNALDKDGLYEYKTYGAMVGGDWQVAKNLVVGAALGYDFGDAKIDGGSDKIEMDNYRLTAFAGTEFGRKIQISGGLTLGGSSYDIKRSGEKSSVDSLNYGAFARISTDILLTPVTRIVPYLGVSAMICDFDSFSDSGAKVSDETVTSVRGTIGVAANYQMFRNLALTLDVSFTHEFCDDELDSSLDYGTGTQKVSEEIGNSDFATIGVGASYSLSPAARVSLGYSLDIGDDLAHHANVGFSYSF